MVEVLPSWEDEDDLGNIHEGEVAVVDTSCVEGVVHIEDATVHRIVDY